MIRLLQTIAAAPNKQDTPQLKSTKSDRPPVDGVLLLDKPSGLTSNAALQRVKRLLGASKAGHVGTLDPMASGLLPICLGEATKFSGYMLAADKAYTADVLLGATSTTGDAEGEITARHPVDVTRSALDEAVAGFLGDIMQTPPMYSAIKRDGKPLYAYARAGETVEVAPRPVTIRSIGVLRYETPQFVLAVRCSKGTYIRVLGEDIGRKLGCGAMLVGLRRDGVGAYEVKSAVTLADLEAETPEQRNSHLLPVDTLIAALPQLGLDEAASRLIATGRRVAMTGPEGGLYRLYGPESRFLGLGELAGGELLPKRLMAGDLGLGTRPEEAQQITKNA